MQRFTRHDMLAGLAVLGAGAMLAGKTLAPGPVSAADSGRLDFHHHYVSPEWMAVLAKQDTIAHFPGLETFRGWSAAKAIEAMDAAGVSVSMLSTTTPGIWFGDDAQARMLARNMNDFGAKLVTDHKGRYRLFAVLPLPNVPASLAEIAYGYDTLHADGISVLSSYGNKWLGDPSFAPVWDELNRRKAIVFSHATAPDCCKSLQPNLDPTTIEFNTDTARTIVSLIESGTAEKYPNIRFIFSHAGGTIPALAGRYFRKQATSAALKAPAAPDTRLGHLRRFYYDTAGSANPVQMQALKMIVPTTQILFGTDYPWAPPSEIVAGLADSGFTAAELQGINRDNGLQLVPKLRA